MSFSTSLLYHCSTLLLFLLLKSPRSSSTRIIAFRRRATPKEIHREGVFFVSCEALCVLFSQLWGPRVNFITVLHILDLFPHEMTFLGSQLPFMVLILDLNGKWVQQVLLPGISKLGCDPWRCTVTVSRRFSNKLEHSWLTELYTGS